MVDIKQIFYDIGGALKGTCDRIYAHSRPKAVEGRPDSYVVVRFPYTIDNEEMNSSGRYNFYTTTVQIEIYVKEKVSSRNLSTPKIKDLSEVVGKVLGLFPINGKTCMAVRPSITLQTDDGNGYSVCIVQASVRTK